ncbi:ABC transporter ATP-binding protein [Paenibacillus glucanolyticus]|uniref:ABC transporter ATP-binding protein n=1 Tax=Paenibacillus glucanolyticus TaxID=59843 RepID=A0A163FHD5_9BACL|nr:MULTISPECIES: ABC transporter ATP-binding protein [Paenibacillus]AWP26238.1 ABC transporter ATP-binding protein [Paenibacillus sp. Cedars]KZS44390.1 ABC transporter ATP-binding protein [Paenibacillus glucanolyticus]MPY16576.1 ABC transporter ATP-binding protein [Paenibacillus glucanolyticus]
MNQKSLLSVRNIHKTYDGDGFKVDALKDVSFALEEGELVAVMGTSGSGKSTLLNIISSLDKPTSGTIELKGKVMDNIFVEPHATHYRRENIGFVFQSFHLLNDLSVEENIAIPLILQGDSEADIQQKVQNMLQLLGLANWRKKRPTQLSGGQQQRVAIGRALITKPPLLLADEPTGNLDYNTSKEILEALVEMRSSLKQSMIMVTHDPNVAVYADRVLFFHDGQIVDQYVSRGKRDIDPILSIFKNMMERSA